MSDFDQDPYAGATSDEEREAVYQGLLRRYEESEYERRKTIYSDFMVDWERERAILQDTDQRTHKLISTFAAGAFGVSFAFISQIVELSMAINIPVLILSWSLFAISIIFSILELKIDSLIQDKLLNFIEKNMERGYRGEPYLEPPRKLITWPGRIFSWVSVGTFITGLVCLLFFVLQNI